MTGQGRICVTGGAGYIGSHACLELSKAGIAPLVVDNLSTGHREAVKYGPFEQLDLREATKLEGVLRQYEIDTVLHFAASAYVGESVEKPDFYYDNNVGGMMSLLKASARADVRRFVLSSSCATYGIPQHIPVSVNAAQAPINPYGMSKLMCEKLLQDIAGQYEIDYAILRYFNVAGADPEGRLFEWHTPETHLIPLALLAAAGRGPELKLFGDDYPTSDGTCIRDYVHVCDLARGHVQALDVLAEGKGPLVVKLGAGRGVSNLQIVNAVQAVTGLGVPHSFGPRREGDPPELVADLTAAKTLLGFNPVRSELETIIADAARGFLGEVSHAVGY